MTQEQRRPVSDRRAAVVADEKIVKERAQWWDPEMKACWDENQACLVEGAAAAIPAWETE